MKTVFKILAISLFASLFWLMCSCSARKVNKQSEKESTQTETIDNSVTEKQTHTNVKTTTETKTDDKNETVTQETIYEPANPSKESFIIEKDGTKVILNNAKKIVRNTTQKNNTQSQTNKYVDSVIKENAKEQKAIEQHYTTKKEKSSKIIDKEAFNWFNLLWFLIPIGIIYYFYKRYKKSIL